MNTNLFKETFVPYHQKLYRIAFRILRDEGNAEDIVQETYIKLWERRKEMQHIENKEAYAVIILRNKCLDFLRKKKAYLSDFEFDVRDDYSVSKEVELRDEIRHVQDLINLLPPQQRLVMQLKHWDEYTDEEIEEVTGMSQINIRVTLSRARKTIREQYLKIKQR